MYVGDDAHIVPNLKTVPKKTATHSARTQNNDNCFFTWDDVGIVPYRVLCILFRCIYFYMVKLISSAAFFRCQ